MIFIDDYTTWCIPCPNSGTDTGMQMQLRFNICPYQKVDFVKGKSDFISKIASGIGFNTTALG